jgi:hypothetical protein
MRVATVAAVGGRWRWQEAEGASDQVIAHIPLPRRRGGRDLKQRGFQTTRV